MNASTQRDLREFLEETFPRIMEDRPADFAPWFFHYFAELVEPEGRKRYARALEWDVRLSGLDPRGKVVVDAGSGFGLQSLSFARLGASRVVGIEASAAMSTTAKKLASRYAPGLPVAFVNSSVSHMPLRDGEADFVYCNEAISHFIDQLGFLSESARVLRPGGRLMVCDGNNAANPRMVKRMYAVWKAFEEGPPVSNLFGHEMARSYRDRRREIIAKALSGLDDAVLDRLAWGTFGLSGRAIIDRAREMLATGRLPEAPPSVDRCPVHPVEGAYIENLIDARRLAADMRRAGFSVRVHAHFGGARSDLVRAANQVLRVFTPVLMPYARSMKIIATKIGPQRLV